MLHLGPGNHQRKGGGAEGGEGVMGRGRGGGRGVGDQQQEWRVDKEVGLLTRW